MADTKKMNMEEKVEVEMDVDMLEKIEEGMDVDMLEKIEKEMVVNMEENNDINVKENRLLDINVKEIGETLTTSLDNTQKNATDTGQMVQDVLTMSGKDMHDKVIQAILDDDNLDMEEKMKFIHQENVEYDSFEENNTNRVSRLQDNKTDNTGKATGFWSENCKVIIYCVATGALFLFSTPVGHNMLASTWKKVKG